MGKPKDTKKARKTRAALEEQVAKLRRHFSDQEHTMRTALRLDAMYYSAARRSLERARLAESKVANLLRHFEKLSAAETKVLKRYGGGLEGNYDRLESTWVQMTGTFESLGFAYGPLLEAMASTHILCAAAIESHINARGSELLGGKLHEKFEFADLEFKWIVLPKLIGKEGFNPGAEPFQSLTRLVRFRNALVHYKKHREPLKYPGVPSFLPKLGLTLSDCARSVECVRCALSTLAEQLGEEVPSLLRRDDAEVDCFEIEFPKSSADEDDSTDGRIQPPPHA